MPHLVSDINIRVTEFQSMRHLIHIILTLTKKKHEYNTNNPKHIISTLTMCVYHSPPRAMRCDKSAGCHKDAFLLWHPNIYEISHTDASSSSSLPTITQHSAVTFYLLRKFHTCHRRRRRRQQAGMCVCMAQNMWNSVTVL